MTEKPKFPNIPKNDGRTYFTKEYIEKMETVGHEILKLEMMTDAWFKRFFGKNKDKIDFILVVMKEDYDVGDSDLLRV